MSAPMEFLPLNRPGVGERSAVIPIIDPTGVLGPIASAAIKAREMAQGLDEESCLRRAVEEVDVLLTIAMAMYRFLLVKGKPVKAAAMAADIQLLREVRRRRKTDLRLQQRCNVLCILLWPLLALRHCFWSYRRPLDEGLAVGHSLHGGSGFQSAALSYAACLNNAEGVSVTSTTQILLACVAALRAVRQKPIQSDWLVPKLPCTALSEPELVVWAAAEENRACEVKQHLVLEARGVSAGKLKQSVNVTAETTPEGLRAKADQGESGCWANVVQHGDSPLTTETKSNLRVRGHDVPTVPESPLTGDYILFGKTRTWVVMICATYTTCEEDDSSTLSGKVGVFDVKGNLRLVVSREMLCEGAISLARWRIYWMMPGNPSGEELAALDETDEFVLHGVAAEHYA